MNKSKPCFIPFTIRFISFFLLFSFCFQQISFAEISLPVKKDPFEKPGISFDLPSSIATIEDSWQAPQSVIARSIAMKQSKLSAEIASGTASPRNDNLLVYLIQDAHTNESGQLNLSKTLDLILKHENNPSVLASPAGAKQSKLSSAAEIDDNLKYVFSEGGVDNNSLSQYRKTKSLSERTRIAKEYLKKGILHGSEYLDLTSNDDFVLWGVEEPSLYAKSFHAYKAVFKERERFDLYLKKIESTINTLKDRLLNPSLLAFDKERQLYLNDKLSLTSYFDILQREAYLRNVDLNQYPSLKALKELKNKEEKIDFTKATFEQQKAFEALSQQDQKELKNLSEPDKSSPFKLTNKDPKALEGFYALLEEKLTQRVIASEVKPSLLKPIAEIVSLSSAPRNDTQYPNLTQYFTYLKLAKSVEAKHVLDELKILEGQILTALQSTEDEKLLIQSQEVTSYLRKLFYFTMTPEDYKEYKRIVDGGLWMVDSQNNPQSTIHDSSSPFTIEHLTGFLNKKIMDLGTYYERSLFLEPGYQDIIKNAESFYEITRDRDQAFIDNMLEKLTEKPSSSNTASLSSPNALVGDQPDSRQNRAGMTQSAVLITGGFHTPNLKALLKQHNISYISITPQVTKETNHKRYEEILLGVETRQGLEAYQGMFNSLNTTIGTRLAMTSPQVLMGVEGGRPKASGARMPIIPLKLEGAKQPVKMFPIVDATPTIEGARLATNPMKERLREMGLRPPSDSVWRSIRNYLAISALNHIDEANERKVSVDIGGHPGASLSTLEIFMALYMFAKRAQDHVANIPQASPALHAVQYALGDVSESQMHLLRQNQIHKKPNHLRQYMLYQAASGQERAELEKFLNELNPLDQKHFDSLQPMEGFSAYPSTTDPGITIPTSSVGLGPATTIALALGYQLLENHGFEVPDSWFYAVVGDGEADEGNYLEMLGKAAEYHLSRLVHIVSYNRQTLDGDRGEEANLETVDQGSTVDRLERMRLRYQAHGWNVIEIRWGSEIEKEFERKNGGTVFRSVMNSLTDSEYQKYTAFSGDREDIRKFLISKDAELQKFLGEYNNERLYELFTDLAGHDLVKLTEALERAHAFPDKPTAIIAHTIKGRDLKSLAGNPLSHKARPNAGEIKELRKKLGVPGEELYPTFEKGSEEFEQLTLIRKQLDKEEKEYEAFKAHNRAQFDKEMEAALAAAGLKNFPAQMPSGVPRGAENKIHSHGMMASGVDLLLAIADKPKESLTPQEALWRPIAERMVVVAGDVATSTITPPATANNRIYGPRQRNRSSELNIASVIKENNGGFVPNLTPSPEGRILSFSIEEMSAMNVALAFGLLERFTGHPIFPIFGVYGAFVKRAADQIKYAAYSRVPMRIMATPTGSSLSPEGGYHQSLTDRMFMLMLPNTEVWELAFEIENRFLNREILVRAATGQNKDQELNYMPGSTLPVRGEEFLKRLKQQSRYEGKSDNEIIDEVGQEYLKGGYRLISYEGHKDYEPADNVVNIFAAGVMVQQAIEASDMLHQKGIYANVIVVSNPTRLYGYTGEKTDYAHLRELVSGEERLWAPVVTVADTVPFYLAPISGILGGLGGSANLGTTEFGVSTPDPEHLFAKHGISKGNIAQTAFLLLEKRDEVGGLVDRVFRWLNQKFVRPNKGKTTTLAVKTLGARLSSGTFDQNNQFNYYMSLPGKTEDGKYTFSKEYVINWHMDSGILARLARLAIFVLKNNHFSKYLNPFFSKIPGLSKLDAWISKKLASDDVDHEEAIRESKTLVRTINDYGGNVIAGKQVEGLPDGVFTANAGLFLYDPKTKKKIFIKTHYAKKQMEEGWLHRWLGRLEKWAGMPSEAPTSFEKRGPEIEHNVQDLLEMASDVEVLDVVQQDEEEYLDWEGEAEIAFYTKKDGAQIMFAGYGHRSEFGAHQKIAAYLQREMVPLKLVNGYFYHLDTAMKVLSDGTVIYYEGAYDKESLRRIEEIVPAEKRVKLSRRDAFRFFANAVEVHKKTGYGVVKTIIANSSPWYPKGWEGLFWRAVDFVQRHKEGVSKKLIQQLGERDFSVVTIPMKEFLKTGGSTKCSVLTLFFYNGLEEFHRTYLASLMLKTKSAVGTRLTTVIPRPAGRDDGSITSETNKTARGARLLTPLTLAEKKQQAIGSRAKGRKFIDAEERTVIVRKEGDSGKIFVKIGSYSSDARPGVQFAWIINNLASHFGWNINARKVPGASQPGRIAIYEGKSYKKENHRFSFPYDDLKSIASGLEKLIEFVASGKKEESAAFYVRSIFEQNKTKMNRSLSRAAEGGSKEEKAIQERFRSKGKKNPYQIRMKVNSEQKSVSIQIVRIGKGEAAISWPNEAKFPQRFFVIKDAGGALAESLFKPFDEDEMQGLEAVYDIQRLQKESLRLELAFFSESDVIDPQALIRLLLDESGARLVEKTAAPVAGARVTDKDIRIKYLLAHPIEGGVHHVSGPEAVPFVKALTLRGVIPGIDNIDTLRSIRANSDVLVRNAPVFFIAGGSIDLAAQAAGLKADYLILSQSIATEAGIQYLKSLDPEIVIFQEISTLSPAFSSELEARVKARETAGEHGVDGFFLKPYAEGGSPKLIPRNLVQFEKNYHETIFMIGGGIDPKAVREIAAVRLERTIVATSFFQLTQLNQVEERADLYARTVGEGRALTEIKRDSSLDELQRSLAQGNPAGLLEEAIFESIAQVPSLSMGDLWGVGANVFARMGVVAIPAVVRHLNDPDPKKRFVAQRGYEALLETNSDLPSQIFETAIDGLLEIVENPDDFDVKKQRDVKYQFPYRRESLQIAIRSLGVLGSREKLGPKRERVARALLDLLSSAKPSNQFHHWNDLRGDASEALAVIGGDTEAIVAGMAEAFKTSSNFNIRKKHAKALVVVGPLGRKILIDAWAEPDSKSPKQSQVAFQILFEHFNGDFNALLRSLPDGDKSFDSTIENLGKAFEKRNQIRSNFSKEKQGSRAATPAKALGVKALLVFSLLSKIALMAKAHADEFDVNEAKSISIVIDERLLKLGVRFDRDKKQFFILNPEFREPVVIDADSVRINERGQTVANVSVGDFGLILSHENETVQASLGPLASANAQTFLRFVVDDDLMEGPGIKSNFDILVADALREGFTSDRFRIEITNPLLLRQAKARLKVLEKEWGLSEGTLFKRFFDTTALPDNAKSVYLRSPKSKQIPGEINILLHPEGITSFKLRLAAAAGRTLEEGKSLPDGFVVSYGLGLKIKPNSLILSRVVFGRMGDEPDAAQILDNYAQLPIPTTVNAELLFKLARYIAQHVETQA